MELKRVINATKKKVKLGEGMESDQLGEVGGLL